MESALSESAEATVQNNCNTIGHESVPAVGPQIVFETTQRNICAVVAMRSSAFILMHASLSGTITNFLIKYLLNNYSIYAFSLLNQISSLLFQIKNILL